MSSYLDNITSSRTFTRVRRIKTLVYALQLVVVLVVSLILVYYDGARLNPLYLPMLRALYFLLLMLVVFAVENILFRVLEIRYAYKDSHRFLIAEGSLRASRNTAIFAALLVLAFMLPAAKVLGEAAISRGALATLDAGQTYRVRFDTTDFLGVTKSKVLRVSVESGTIRVSLYKDGVAVSTGVVLTAGSSREFPISYETLASYTAQVDNIDGAFAATFSYTVVVGLPNDFAGFLALIALLLLLAHVGFIAYLVPVKRRYAGRSIYSTLYEHEPVPEENPWLPPRHPDERPWYEMRSEWSPAAAPWPTPAAGRRYVPPPPTERVVEAEELPPAPDEEAGPELPPPPPPPGFEEAAPVAPAPAVRPTTPAAPTPPAPAPSEEPPAPYLLEAAEKAHLAGDHATALAEYEKVLARDRSNLAALLGKVEALMALGRPSEALEALDRVLDTDPNHQRALLAKGKLLETRGELDAALECYEKIARGKPEYVEALRRKAEVLQRLGENEMALAALEEAQGLAPGDRSLGLAVAKLREALGKGPPAAPSSPPSGGPKEGDERRTLQELQGKGIGYLHVGMYREALGSFDAILARDARNVFAHVSKGKVLERMGLTENALAAYKTALTACGPNGEILSALGELLLRLGREGEATQYLAQAAELNPKLEGAEERIAKYKAAKAEMERVLGKLAEGGVLKAEAIEALEKAGYASLAALGGATLQELLTVRGVDPKAAQRILEEAKTAGRA